MIIFVAFGDDTEDPVGECFRGNQRICDKLDIEKFTNQILNRTIEWNRLQCLLNDSTKREAFCFSGDNNYTIEKQAYASCFSKLDDYFKERLRHINDTDYSVIFPCPEDDNLLNQTYDKDESGN
jgi:hypothetical protein